MNPPGTVANPSKPRIAFLHQDLVVGGGTIFLINLVGELVRRGIPTHVFTLADINPLAADFERQHIPVSSEQEKGTIFEDRVNGALEKLARFKPNVVVGNVATGACEVMRYLPSQVIRVGVIHAVVQVEWAVKYASTVDRFVTVSMHVREMLRQKPELKEMQIDCVELGIPIPDTIHRERLGAGRPLRILYLGRLEELAKRVRLFPAILERLKELQIPFTWTIAGEGPEEQFLRSKVVTDNPNQQVHFAGLVPYSDVPALLSSHDILLLTSDTEVFPLSLHEGMAAGLVPVASDLPGRVRDIVTPDAGILVPPANVCGYAEAIGWLHEHRDKMQAMSARARELIGREYSVAGMADRWLTMLTASPPAPAIWPNRWHLRAPLYSSRPWWFSKPVRTLRRIAVKARWASKKWINGGR
jgi:glycosyltransferase involved in cell wall biosynthesis